MTRAPGFNRIRALAASLGLFRALPASAVDVSEEEEAPPASVGEDLHTGSAFVGWNPGLGERLRLELTPMRGGVPGATEGVAPGLELARSYGRLVLGSENEYVLVPADADASFFSSWTELSEHKRKPHTVLWAIGRLQDLHAS